MPSRIKLVLLIAAVILVAHSTWAGTPQQLQKITINYPTRTGQVWPLYLAKEGGYYQKYGFDVTLVFGVHPAGIAMVVSDQAVMTPYTLEQAMQAATRDGSLVALGSPFKKSLFELMASKDIASIRDLKGKRIGVSQIGDAPYNYTIGLIGKFGLAQRDVQWLPIGTDVNGRAAALVSGRVDATMITAPVYFKLEQEGYKGLANISDYDDIYAPSVYLFKKSTVAANPKLPELLIKAHAEAIKRFYDDKAFAVRAYQGQDKQSSDDVGRIYDMLAKTNQLERVPYVLSAAIKSITEQANSETATQLKDFDPHKVVDNSLIDRLVKEGFFEKTFGPSTKSEQEKKAKAAYK